MRGWRLGLDQSEAGIYIALKMEASYGSSASARVRNINCLCMLSFSYSKKILGESLKNDSLLFDISGKISGFFGVPCEKY